MEGKMEGNIEAPPVEPQDPDSSWSASLPTSFTQAGMLAANKGMTVLQPKMVS